MAEYINRNALLESIRSGEGTNEHKIFAALCVSDAPTADVVEVAREIFDDINAIRKEYLSGDIDGNELYIRLYQLEKKYTESAAEK